MHKQMEPILQLNLNYTKFQPDDTRRNVPFSITCA